MTVAPIGLACLLGSAWALDGNDTLSLELSGDVSVEGLFLKADPDQVWLTPADGRALSVPLVLVEHAMLNGEPIGLDVLQREVTEAWELRKARAGSAGPLPHPAAVAGASLLFAGSGHAMLGEWRPFTGYAAAEGVLLGTIALNVAIVDPRPLPALITLDVLFKIYAAQESLRIARRRRDTAMMDDREGATP